MFMGPIMIPSSSLICFYRSLCVLIDFNWSLWDTIGPYASLWFFMGIYVSSCILMDSNLCLCVPMVPCF